jgi:hypothetical protein
MGGDIKKINKNLILLTGPEKNTVESKGMTYGKHEWDAVRKFSYEAWLILTKPINTDIIIQQFLKSGYMNTCFKCG